ncbi:heat shock protein 90, partial [mine drainage metagenome]
RPELMGEGGELGIEIRWDADAHTLSISDNGIGMSRDEVIENIGTIARSGTRKFLEALSGDARQDSRLIGQFGVGFYSAFVVADRVTLETRRASAPAAEGVRWVSDGSSAYTLASIERAARGTTLTLHLKPDEDEFVESWHLRELVKKYSEHIGFPIRMPKLVDGKPGDELETVNHAAALWTQPKSELQDEDYQNFYKTLTHDFNAPLAWTHNRVEGKQSYTLLLYVPEKPPFEAMFSGRDERKGLKLYIRRVFIMDASEQLLPAYLRFVRGVVDSDDLPLNVSREILQENRLVSQIRAACSKRTLDLLGKLASDEAPRYAEFYKSFGNVLKEGIVEDNDNRERIAGLLRFASTHNSDATQNVSLDDYIGRMQVGQESIYYLTAESWVAARHSAQIEALAVRGIEVLLMSERIDEWMMGYLSEYQGKTFRHAGKGELELPLDAAEKERREAAEKDAAPLLDKLKKDLGERVSAVRLSHRLTESPACLVLEAHDMALHTRRLMAEAGHAMPAARPVLEINAAHPLLQRYAAESDSARGADLALLLLEQAEVAEGAQLEDPAAFVKRVNRLLLGAAA